MVTQCCFQYKHGHLLCVCVCLFCCVSPTKVKFLLLCNTTWQIKLILILISIKMRRCWPTWCVESSRVSSPPLLPTLLMFWRYTHSATHTVARTTPELSVCHNLKPLMDLQRSFISFQGFECEEIKLLKHLDGWHIQVLESVSKYFKEANHYIVFYQSTTSYFEDIETLFFSTNN